MIHGQNTIFSEDILFKKTAPQKYYQRKRHDIFSGETAGDFLRGAFISY